MSAVLWTAAITKMVFNGDEWVPSGIYIEPILVLAAADSPAGVAKSVAFMLARGAFDVSLSSEEGYNVEFSVYFGKVTVPKLGTSLEGELV